MIEDTEVTRRSLILRVGSGDPDSWRQYVSVYLPKIEEWARSCRVRADIMDDVVQEVLLRVVRGAKHFAYDESKGRYRAYLRTIAHNVASDVLRKVSRQPRTNGEMNGSDPIAASVDKSAGDSLLNRLIEGERVELFRQAEQQTRLESSLNEWECYHQSVYSNPKRTPLEIAASLGIKIGNYYKCKSVFVARLNRNFEELDR